MMLTAFSQKIVDISNLDLNTQEFNIKYYKQEAMILNELIGNYISRYFNLAVSDVNIFKDNDKYGLLFSQLDGKPLKYNKSNLYNFIEYIYKEYNDVNLIKDLFKVIVVDIIMGNPCRFPNTLLVLKENNSWNLKVKDGFAYSYLAYNDLKHPPLEGLDFHEHYGELYTNVLADLPKLLDQSLYLQKLLNKYIDLDMNNVLDAVLNIYDISSPSYLTYRILNYEYHSKKLIKEKILRR